MALGIYSFGEGRRTLRKKEDLYNPVRLPSGITHHYLHNTFTVVVPHAAAAATATVQFTTGNFENESTFRKRTTFDQNTLHLKLKSHVFIA